VAGPNRVGLQRAILVVLLVRLMNRRRVLAASLVAAGVALLISV
jgi:hypothetical protein